MKKWAFLLVFTCAFAPLAAQDVHFTQFFNAPALMNPALTGNFSGSIRVHGNYRSQWSSVSPGVPFRTTSLFADGNTGYRLPLDIKPGVNILHDKTGDSRFSTFQFNLLAAREMLRPENGIVKSLSAGALLGFSQRSINSSYLYFDNQYNGNYFDPSLSTGEDFARNGFFHANSSIGVLSKLQYNQIDGEAGLSIHNLLPAGQSFYKESGVILDRRYVFSLGAGYPISQTLRIESMINFMRQGKMDELLIAGRLNYNLVSYDVTLITGAIARTRDAGAIMAGLRKENITGTISYDFNLSSLTPASRYRGGFELSIIWILAERKEIIIPKTLPCQPWF